MLEKVDKVLKASSCLTVSAFMFLILGLILAFGGFGSLSIAISIPIILIGIVGTVIGVISMILFYIDWIDKKA